MDDIVVYLTFMSITLALALWFFMGGKISKVVSSIPLGFMLWFWGTLLIGNTFPWWFDSREETAFYHNAARAATAGQTEVPLESLTSFAWETMCRVSGYDFFSPGGTDKRSNRVLTALGTLDLPQPDWFLGTDYSYYLFKTPENEIVQIPELWSRFSPDYINSFAGRKYRNILKGVPYRVEFQSKQHKDTENPCHRRGDVFLKITQR